MQVPCKTNAEYEAYWTEHAQDRSSTSAGTTLAGHLSQFLASNVAQETGLTIFVILLSHSKQMMGQYHYFFLQNPFQSSILVQSF
jgi:hypothetical protein